MIPYRVPQTPYTSRLITMFATSTIEPTKSQSVAVIGAGAGGLVCARELRREGHKPVIYEQNNQVGGTWVYNPKTESDPIGLDPSRTIVHTSLYDSLRTNLPREVMGFLDYPFVPQAGSERDPRRFPGHREVLCYLQDFADEFELTDLIRFDTEVCFVGLGENGKWKVNSRNMKTCDDHDHDQLNKEVYDAVVVCNGHYTEPRVADIHGINVWLGKQMHSHNYRTPEPFRDQVVVLIGSSASAVDISRDIAGVAKEVHIASRSAEEGTLGKQPGCDNMWLHSMIESAHDNGTVTFEDGSVVRSDIILHCTGYKYHFPFLKINDIVNVDDNCVGPLYQHIFPPVLAPSLSFVGLPWKVVPFPVFELQSKWITAVLSGRISLPFQEEMNENISEFYATLESSGVPKRYTHCMADSQFEYNMWLADKCGIPGIEDWRKQMYYATGMNRRIRPNTYRDEWEDQHLLLQAHDFLQYTSKKK